MDEGRKGWMDRGRYKLMEGGMDGVMNRGRDSHIPTEASDLQDLWYLMMESVK